MPLYYFDTRDNYQLIVDDEGLDYPNLDTVKIEAARSLAELARDAFPAAFSECLPSRSAMLSARSWEQ